VKSQQAVEGIMTIEGQLVNLRNAVRALYYSAVWHPDRPVNEIELWTAVRDAAGFAKGNSPKELPFDGVQVSYPVDRLRQIGHLAGAKKGRDFGTPETRAFLLLHGQELVDKLDATVRQFLEEKLS
jgi:hypothetical protein